MEAHRSYERFERSNEVVENHHPRHATSAAFVVRRRWLLGIGSAVGAAGVVALAVGLLV